MKFPNGFQGKGFLTIKLHHKIFLTYTSLFLVTIGGIFAIASYFIRNAFDSQIREEAAEFRTRISETHNHLVADIEEKVETERTDPGRRPRHQKSRNTADDD